MSAITPEQLRQYAEDAYDNISHAGATVMNDAADRIEDPPEGARQKPECQETEE